MEQSTLKGKFRIEAILRVESGMHIGTASDFAPIGAVDSSFIRDPFSKQPIIPGSSLKGKIRTLLVKSMTDGYIMKDIQSDSEEVKRLFGTASKTDTRPARLQFFDLRVTQECLKLVEQMEMDTYMGEVKFENTISRVSAVANPRQIERVPAGIEFRFILTYNIEKPEEVKEDMAVLANGIQLLQMDYLGGNGSRGYGRVSFRDFAIKTFCLTPAIKSELEKQAVMVCRQLESSGVL